MIGETLLLPGRCATCDEPLVLVPAGETLEVDDLVVARATGRWRWLGYDGQAHECMALPASVQ